MLEYANSEQESIEEGLPMQDDTYYFYALITKIRYQNKSFNDSREFFNICSFQTDTPLPDASLNPYNKKIESTLIGSSIELNEMSRYKVKAKKELNKDFEQYQYRIVQIWEQEQTSEDILDNYLKFLVTPNQYKLIKEEDPDFVKKIFEDENYTLPRLKGQRQSSMDNIHENVLKYRDYVDLIGVLGKYPDFTLSAILSAGELASSPKLVLQKIEDDPYVLMKLSRFGWKRVDKLALSLKPEMISSESRLISFCTSILEQISESTDGGHTWIAINNPMDVKNSMSHLLKENIPECKDVIKPFFESERQLTEKYGCGVTFYVDSQRIGLAKYFRSEQKILKNLERIQSGTHLKNTIKLEDAIRTTNEWMSKNVGEPVSLTEEQASVVEATLNNDVVILTAHAGAGKSTSIKGIIELWKDKSIACCALSAKAAIRIKETTGMESFTIHRLLHLQNGKFFYNDKNPLPYDIIIIDECSMINIPLFLSILKAVPSKGKVILVFDDAQLPAIGAGSVAKDLLSSNFCIKRLTKIHRQAAKSGIKLDANKIRQQIDVFEEGIDYKMGKLPKYIKHGEKGDMHYFNINSSENIHKQAILLYKELISGGGIGGEKPIKVEDISIIVPMKSNMINCTDTFNMEIQDLLLKEETQYISSGTYADKEHHPRIFKLGSRVIRRKNDYEKSVFNGEVGTIIEISNDRSNFTVRFDSDNRVQFFNSKELAFFDLAYALTVHSMQGSENKAIIFVMDIRHKILLDSTLFYTAVTRAKDLNFVIFQPNAYITAYTTDKVCSRQTFLPLLINGFIENKDIKNPDEIALDIENEDEDFI